MIVRDPIKRKFIFVVVSVLIAITALMVLEVVSKRKQQKYNSAIENNNALRNLLSVCIINAKSTQQLALQILEHTHRDNDVAITQLFSKTDHVLRSVNTIVNGGTYYEEKVLRKSKSSVVTFSISYNKHSNPLLNAGKDALYFNCLTLKDIIHKSPTFSEQSSENGKTLSAFLLRRSLDKTLHEIEIYHDNLLYNTNLELNQLTEEYQAFFKTTNLIRFIVIALIATTVLIIIVTALFQIDKILAISRNYMERIDDANNMIHTLFESLPIGVLLLDENKHINKYNNVALRMLANGDKDLLFSEDLFVKEKLVNQVQGEYLEAEVTPMFSHQHYSHFLFKSKYIEYKGKEMRLDAFIDISQRKKTEQRLKFRNSIFQAVNQISEQITPSKKISIRVITDNILVFAKQLNVSYAELHELYQIDKNLSIGSSSFRQINGVYERNGTPAIFDSNTFPRINIELNRKGIYFGQTSELPSMEQQQFESKGITSFALFAIKVETQAIATLAMFHSDEAQKWSVDEINGLKFFAQNIGTTIEKYILDKQLQRTNKQLEVYSAELKEQSEELLEKNIILKNQRKEVEEANRLKSEFLANISHELRTPMNAVIGISKMLGKYNSDNLTQKQAEGLQLIHTSANNLLELINDILDMSKVEAGKMEIKPSWFNVQASLETIKNLGQTLALEKNIELYFEIHDLPFKVFTDEKKYHQIVMNIIGNAIKFTDRGVVKVDVLYEDGNLKTKIEDTGCGIAKDDIPKIFDQFKQLDGSASRMHKGTGLGLSLCKKLIEILGGNITVESEINKGTLMEINLPVKVEELDEGVNLTSVMAQKLKENMRILIIEDDDNNIFLYREFLTEQPVQLMQVKTGVEGLDATHSFTPDLILLDINLPDISGLEIVKRLNKEKLLSEIPTIIISAIECQDELKDYPIAAYLKKPISIHTFISTIVNITTKQLKHKFPNTPLNS